MPWPKAVSGGKVSSEELTILEAINGLTIPISFSDPPVTVI